MAETILIVDDESSHLRMTEYTISQKLGYHVVTAGGREEAVRWIVSSRRPQPDLVLLDLSLPAVEGLQAIREIKSCRPQLPIIALVVYGDDDGAGQAVQAGVTDFLSKPVTLDRLKLSLRNALMIRCLNHMIAQFASGSGFVQEQEMADPSASALSDHMAVLFDEKGRVKKLKSIEEEVIRLALHYNNGCMTRAARQLGIGRSTLYRRISEIDRDGYISRANQATRPIMRVSSGKRS